MIELQNYKTWGMTVIQKKTTELQNIGNRRTIKRMIDPEMQSYRTWDIIEYRQNNNNKKIQQQQNTGKSFMLQYKYQRCKWKIPINCQFTVYTR